MDQNSRAHPCAACACCEAPQASAAQSLANTVPAPQFLFGHDAAARLQGKCLELAGRLLGRGLSWEGRVACSVVSTVTETAWLPRSDWRVPAGARDLLGLLLPGRAFLAVFFHVVLGLKSTCGPLIVDGDCSSRGLAGGFFTSKGMGSTLLLLDAVGLCLSGCVS